MTDSIEPIIDISASDSVSSEITETYYLSSHIESVLRTTLKFMSTQRVALPYYKDLDEQLWEQKPKQLGVYLTDSIEGRDLNLEARDKNYATNILSYPSDLPAFILVEMDEIPLGELVICHEVVEQQAKEQNKAVLDHVTHLLVHGILHLLGFDHELGEVEQDEMEGFEIDILQRFAIDNPYLAK